MEANTSFEPDAVRLARDLARGLGLRSVVALGCRRPVPLAALHPDLEVTGLDTPAALEACRRRWPGPEWIDWDPESGRPPALSEERLAVSILLCDALLERLEDPEPLLSILDELLEHAPAAIVATPERDLAGRSGDNVPRPVSRHEWNAADLVSLLESSGLRIGWMGLGRSSAERLDRNSVVVVLDGARGPHVRALLASGARNLLLDADGRPPGDAGEERSGRVCIVSYEFVGPTRTGGIGTSYTSLAEALAGAGQEVTVLFTGWRDPEDETAFAHWADDYTGKGIELCELRAEELPAARCAHSQAERSYLAYLWLRERDLARPFDVIHFPDTLGHGYYSLLARRQGWAFGSATMAVSCHSPTVWIRETAGMPFDTGEEYADDYLERASLAMADIVISPSAYMLGWIESRGWDVPERAYVQQHVQSHVVDRALTDTPEEERASRDGEIDEIVFFGRLEPRKGFPLFCDALDVLARDDDLRHLSILFLGKQGKVEGQPAADYLEQRASAWPWEWGALDSLPQPEAIRRLTREGGRLVVLPSPIDNLPHTVQETIALGLPFISSRGGGSGELIHPLDVERCTFDPWGREDDGDGDAQGRPDPEPLATKLREALRSVEFAPVRPAADPAETERAWVGWHRRIASRPSDERRHAATNGAKRGSAPGSTGPSVTACAVSGDRGSVEVTASSLEAQDYARLEVLRTDGPGASARNDAIRSDRADYLLFLAAGAVAKPGLVSALVPAAEGSGADVVSCVCETGGEGAVSRLVPVGGPRFAGLLGPWFGKTGYLVRRVAFDSVGGFSRAGEPGSEDADLLGRLALAGHDVQVVPEPLVAVPDELAQATSRRLEHSASSSRAAAALYEGIADERLRGLATTSQALWTLRGQLYEEVGTLRWEARELGSKVQEQDERIAELSSLHAQVVESRSWRLTAPIRWLARRARRIKDR